MWHIAVISNEPIQRAWPVKSDGPPWNFSFAHSRHGQDIFMAHGAWRMAHGACARKPAPSSSATRDTKPPASITGTGGGIGKRWWRGGNEQRQVVKIHTKRRWLKMNYKIHAAIFTASLVLSSATTSAWAASNNGLCSIKIEGINQSGFIDQHGKMVIDTIYEEVGDFLEGYAYFKKNGKYGYIDMAGNEVIPATYDMAGNFSDGLANFGKATGSAINRETLFGYIDKAGKVVIPPKLNYPGTFVSGLAPVKDSSGKFGFIDKTGKFKIPAKFESASKFSEGRAAVKIGSSYGFIDQSGRTVISPKYESANDFSEGLARVKLNEKYGYIDASGKMVISPKFEFAFNFKNGLARIEKNRIYGYISKDGSEVMPPTFDDADDFLFERTSVKFDGMYAIIDVSGSIVATDKYKSMVPCANGLFIAQIDRRSPPVILDRNGSRVVEFDKQDRERQARQDARDRTFREEREKKQAAENEDYTRRSNCQHILPGKSMTYSEMTMVGPDDKKVIITNVFKEIKKTQVRYLDIRKADAEVDCIDIK